MQVEEELSALGLSTEAASGIIKATQVGSLELLKQLLGAENDAVLELGQLFGLAEAYGYADYLQLDTGCVRGLAYYTGSASLHVM
jgi:histidyl-tRNA synthetase